MVDDVELPLEHAYLPPDDGERAPAVVVLHGRGADERDLLQVARHLPDDLATVSLRAPTPLMGGFTWYELDLSAGGLHESQPDAEDLRESLDLARESVVAAVDGYGLDPDRIGLLGFSQGAVMSFSLLLEDPPSYAWVAGLHGYLSASHADLEPDGIDGRPVFIGAGTADQMIPEARAAAAADRLSDVGCEVTYRTYDTGHGIGPAELQDVVTFVETHH